MSEAQVIKALNEAGKPLKAGEIAEITGLDKKEIDHIIKILRTEEVIHSPIRCFYEPK